MNVKVMLSAAVAAVALAASAAFDEAERNAIRKSVAEAESRLRAAPALDGKAITLLPVKGDLDHYCENLVIGALVNAGKTCVVSNDEKGDARFKRILSEIKWDERQTTLKSIDPKTADELGHLKSTQILLEARVEVFRRGRRRIPVAELSLLAYEVKTKQYVWTASIAVNEMGRPWPDASEFNVRIDFGAVDGAAALAGRVSGAVRDTVAGYGFRVNGEGPVDLELSVAFAQETFDKSGEYLVLKGTARARLVSRSGEGVLHEKSFDAKGRRGLGEAEAVKNLADAMSAEMRKWLDGTLEPRAFFAKHRDFVLAVGR